jgi:hypothetical protein
MRPRSALFPLCPLFVAAITLAAVAACSGQGEGERCDHRAGSNGDSDCQSGLSCQNPPASIVKSPYGICCPPDLTHAATAACSANGGVLDANPAPPEASPEETSTESGAEAMPDGTAPDAPDGTAPDAPDGIALDAPDGTVLDAPDRTAPDAASE